MLWQKTTFLIGLTLYCISSDTYILLRLLLFLNTSLGFSCSSSFNERPFPLLADLVFEGFCESSSGSGKLSGAFGSELVNERWEVAVFRVCW